MLIYKKIETRYCRNITRTVKNEITTDVSKLETAENFCRYRIRIQNQIARVNSHEEKNIMSDTGAHHQRSTGSQRKRNKRR